MKPSADTITMLVTTQLDDEDLEEFQEASRHTEMHMREWRAQRAADKEKEAEKLRENMRLMEVGRNYEQNIKKLAAMAGAKSDAS